MSNGSVRMSDIIRDAAAIPTRKRKLVPSEPKQKVDSILNGAVDDLFSANAQQATGAVAALGSSTANVFAPTANKSELVFDEKGNMVLQQVSTTTAVDRLPAAVEATTTVESATCGYDFAYRKPKPTKWSPEDTTKFYEALELYGSDQMLINTALPHFTPVQIRQKFKAEERNNPSKFNKILYGSKKKLNSTKFEQQHGLIVSPVFDHKSHDNAGSIVDRIGELVDAAVPDTESPEQEPTPSNSRENSDPLASLFQ
jgi:hypothetical protein